MFIFASLHLEWKKHIKNILMPGKIFFVLKFEKTATFAQVLILNFRIKYACNDKIT